MRKQRMLGPRGEPGATGGVGEPAVEKKGGKVRLSEHVLMEELRKEAKFEVNDFCNRLERRYEISDKKEFNVSLITRS